MSEFEAKLVPSTNITPNAPPEFSQVFVSSKTCLIFESILYYYYYYLILHSMSNFLPKNPSIKSRKKEESREILAFDHFERIKES